MFSLLRALNTNSSANMSSFIGLQAKTLNNIQSVVAVKILDVNYIDFQLSSKETGHIFECNVQLSKHLP